MLFALSCGNSMHKQQITNLHLHELTNFPNNTICHKVIIDPFLERQKNKTKKSSTQTSKPRWTDATFFFHSVFLFATQKIRERDSSALLFS